MAAARNRNRPQSDATKHVSLTQFVRDKELARAREGCVICKLPAEIRAQLGRGATRRGFTREDQVAWLKGPCGAKGVTVEGLANHLNGKHDREEDSNGTA
jgi:hypothetical protein